MKKLIVCAWLTLLGAPAFAYNLTTSRYLFGDWEGARTHWLDKGISFSLGHGSETAHNFSGGAKSYTAYTDQWVFGAGFDFEKLGAWKGGTAQVMITNRNGENLGGVAQIGNDMLIQEVYGRGQTWHLTQFWFDQTFGREIFDLKFGRMTVGEDFATFSCDFQNLSFCGAQPGNIVGSYWVNWPTSQWAARLKIHANENTFWQIGAYQVNPRYVDDDYARHRGLSLDDPSGDTGALIPFEFSWKPQWEGRMGSYTFGVWYNTSPGSDLEEDIFHQPRGLTNLEPLQHGGQYGAYLAFLQQLTGTKALPGWFLFLNVSQADRATAAVDRQISLGGQYRGPFHRPQDSIGLGVACTDNNSRYADYIRENNIRTGQNQIVGSGCEYDGEIYYSYAPIASLFLRPNLQYILQPGGTRDNSDAFIAGLKTGVAF